MTLDSFMPAKYWIAPLALQDKKLIWKAARGVYAIEEQAVADILAADGLLNGLEPAAG